MRKVLFVTFAATVASYDFSGLLNKIQLSTLNFDKQVEDAKNSEDGTIHTIELQERNLDRQLDSIREKFHLRPAASSLLEKRRRKKPHHRHVERVAAVVTDNDEQLIQDAELKREKAAENVLAVEKEISELPQRLFPSHTNGDDAQDE
jgi:hypothetical protein